MEYYLTETGAALIPFIAHLKKWGDKQIEKEKNKTLKKPKNYKQLSFKNKKAIKNFVV